MEISKNITEGTIESVSDVINYGSAGKRLINFRLKTHDEYSTMLEFTLFNDKIDKHMAKLAVGNKLKVQYNVKGKEFNERIYHTLNAWAIELLSGNEAEVANQSNDDFDIDEDVF